MFVPPPVMVSVLLPLLLETVPPSVNDWPLLAIMVALSFNATEVLIALAVPAITTMSAPLPPLSMVRTLEPATTNELALVKESAPRLSLASNVTVRKAVPTPRMAVSPGLPGTLGFQLAVPVQTPSTSLVQTEVKPVAGTVISPDTLVCPVTPVTTAWICALPAR